MKNKLFENIGGNRFEIVNEINTTKKIIVTIENGDINDLKNAMGLFKSQGFKISANEANLSFVALK